MMYPEIVFGVGLCPKMQRPGCVQTRNTLQFSRSACVFVMYREIGFNYETLRAWQFLSLGAWRETPYKP